MVFNVSLFGFGRCFRSVGSVMVCNEMEVFVGVVRSPKRGLVADSFAKAIDEKHVLTSGSRRVMMLGPAKMFSHWCGLAVFRGAPKGLGPCRRL